MLVVQDAGKTQGSDRRLLAPSTRSGLKNHFPRPDLVLQKPGLVLPKENLRQIVCDLDRVNMKMFTDRFALECVFKKNVVVVPQGMFDVVEFVVFRDGNPIFVGMTPERDQVVGFHDPIVGKFIRKESPKFEFFERGGTAKIAIAGFFILAILRIAGFSFRFS